MVGGLGPRSRMSRAVEEGRTRVGQVDAAVRRHAVTVPRRRRKRDEVDVRPPIFEIRAS